MQKFYMYKKNSIKNAFAIANFSNIWGKIPGEKKLNGVGITNRFAAVFLWKLNVVSLSGAWQRTFYFTCSFLAPF